MSALSSRLRRPLSFANVTSGLALFVALGGTSYAAIELPANGVGSDQIRRGAVGTSEIRTGGVNSAEIKAGGVSKSEIRAGGVGASELHTGSVRSPEIKTDAVKSDEIARNAVTSDEIQDGTIQSADISTAARGELSGTPGYRAAVSRLGAKQAGNATTAGKTGTGTYTVDFGHDVSACVATATLARVKNGTGFDDPDAGRITVAPGATATSVNVNTFGVTGTAAADEPFHVIVSC